MNWFSLPANADAGDFCRRAPFAGFMAIAARRCASRREARYLRALFAGFIAIAAALDCSAAASPDEPWRMVTPESQGFSGTKLEALRADLAARKTRAFLVIRNDAIVCEWHAPGEGAQTKYGTASLAKGGSNPAAAEIERLTRMGA